MVKIKMAILHASLMCNICHCNTNRAEKTCSSIINTVKICNEYQIRKEILLNMHVIFSTGHSAKPQSVYADTRKYLYKTQYTMISYNGIITSLSISKQKEG